METNEFPYWLMDNWLISSGEHVGEKYSFKNHQYMWGIASDNHNYRVVQKSAQCGISEIEVASMLYLLDTRAGNTLYIFPAKEQMTDFVDGRVKTAINGNPFFKEGKFDGNFNTRQIQYTGEGTDRLRIAYFRGSNKMTQIISIDASALFVDEVDQCDHQNLAALEKRLGAASDPIQHWFSTPTIPDMGINAIYHESDQRKWHIKCDSCNHWQWLDWETNVRFDYVAAAEDPEEIITNERIICSKCGAELDRLKPGEWVAAYPKRDIHGYHISKLFSPLANLKTLCMNSMKTDYGSVLHFWNQDLGLPYAPTEAKLSKEDLDRCVMEYTIGRTAKEQCYMGVDVGIVLHVIISGLISLEITPGQQEVFRGYIYINTVNEFSDLDRLMKQYDIQYCVIDAMPERRKAQEFADRHAGRVALCYYEGERTEKELWRPGKSRNTIITQRTLAMSHLYAQISGGQVALPRNAEAVDGFYDQMCAPQLVFKEDSTGERRPAYPKTLKPDHFYHASVYEMLARQKAVPIVRIHRREWY